MENRTYIQEQNYYLNNIKLTDSKLEQDVLGEKYYFDVNNDTSKNSSSDIADSPIDAGRGATLQDKRVINMKTVGLSGKFSARCHNNTSFRESDNRIGIIIRYFEDALAKQKIYTVCRKGTMFYNMMLDKVNIRMGDYCSTIDISLSFIEVNIITFKEYKSESNLVYTIPERFNKTLFSSLSFNGVRFYKELEVLAPKIYYTINEKGLYIGVENTSAYKVLDDDWIKKDEPSIYSKSQYYLSSPCYLRVFYYYEYDYTDSSTQEVRTGNTVYGPAISDFKVGKDIRCALITQYKAFRKNIEDSPGVSNFKYTKVLISARFLEEYYGDPYRYDWYIPTELVTTSSGESGITRVEFHLKESKETNIVLDGSYFN